MYRTTPNLKSSTCCCAASRIGCRFRQHRRALPSDAGPALSTAGVGWQHQRITERGRCSDGALAGRHGGRYDALCSLPGRLVQSLPAPNDPQRQNFSPCGIQAGEESLVLAWDRGRLGDSAPNWADFWDIARHPGKRALRLDPRGTLEIALMADGVGPGDVYAVLSSPSGVDRAFRKLDQLRPYLIWWRNPEEATRIMNSGAVLMLSTPFDRLAKLGPRVSFSAQWHQSLRQKLSWAIPRNVSPEQTATIIKMLRDQTPLHDDTQDAPQDGHDLHTLSRSDRFWSMNFDALQKRFQSWLTSTQ